jgi:ribonuclease Z
VPRPPEDELEVAGMHLVGIAEGGVETNLRIPELKLMFDIGMCPPRALKFRRLLVSHGHADHLGGLHYFISQRGMMKLAPPIIHLPAEIAPIIEEILGAWARIEGFEYRYELRPAEPGGRYEVGRDLHARAIRTQHRVPSLAWVVERTTRRILDEFRGCTGDELLALREAGEVVTHEVVTPLVCVTGDTTIDTFLNHELIRKCKLLVHECTSWDQQRSVESTRSWGHTHIDELLEHAEKFEGEALVLVHRSLRHSRRYAQRIVRDRFPPELGEKVFVFGHDDRR